jgi:tetratricopeptide (TPR) repeat protein
VTSSSGQNTQRINEAIEIANQTIAANPESPLGYAVRAMALDWSGQFNLALGAVERALEIDPNSIIAKAHLANIYRNLGQGDLAQEVILEAIAAVQANPESVDRETRAQVYRNYGRILYAVLGDAEAALEPYDLARRTMPSHTYITIEMAEVYFVLGGQSSNTSYIDTAFQLLEETLDVAPRDLILLETLGRYYIALGHQEDGTEMYTRCVEVAPDYIPCLSQLGGLQFYASNYALAIQNLSRATQLGSTAPEDWYWLGRSYARLSQCNLAEAPLQEGYRLRQDIESEYVGLDDFITAFRQCGLVEPSQSTPIETDSETDIQSDIGAEAETENLPPN